MKKLIVLGIVALGVLVLGGLALAYFSLNSIVKTGIETVGPQLTGVEIRLQNVNVSPVSGRGQLSGLFLGNPTGYKTPSAITIGSVKIGVKTASVFSDTAEIDELKIEAPEITFEGGLKGSNLSKILENIQTASAGAGRSDTKVQSGKKFLVKDLLVQSGKIRLSATPLAGKEVTVPLPDLHLQNIGTGAGGVSAAELTKQIMVPLLAAVTEAVAKKLPSLGAGVKDLNGRVQDLGKGATNHINKTVRDLKDLLKKK